MPFRRHLRVPFLLVLSCTALVGCREPLEQKDRDPDVITAEADARAGTKTYADNVLQFSMQNAWLTSREETGRPGYHKVVAKSPEGILLTFVELEGIEGVQDFASASVQTLKATRPDLETRAYETRFMHQTFVGYNFVYQAGQDYWDGIVVSKRAGRRDWGVLAQFPRYLSQRRKEEMNTIFNSLVFKKLTPDGSQAAASATTK
jgi:hypothetical protein